MTVLNLNNTKQLYVFPLCKRSARRSVFYVGQRFRCLHAPQIMSCFSAQFRRTLNTDQSNFVSWLVFQTS